jgi:isopenicillin N synthase-like dioxygenase
MNAKSKSDALAVTLPIVEVLDGRALLAACESGGMFYLCEHGIDPSLLNQVLEETRIFFDQDEASKQAIHIKNSSNHRGWGMLKNYRDWREQIHIGVEAEAAGGEIHEADYWRLWGPNQWPSESYKTTMLTYMSAVQKLSCDLLRSLAREMGRADDFFTARMAPDPYLLIKAIAYLPQPEVSLDNQASQAKTGVPAHCDWSWLTLLLQDDVGGLEAQDKNGDWHEVKPLKNSLVVNTGELLEIESGGTIRANPHRVINERIDRRRFSVPMFINAALDAKIYPAGEFAESTNSSEDEKMIFAASENHEEHIHKVIKPGTRLAPFVFGDSEHKRKHEGIWCFREDCLREV